MNKTFYYFGITIVALATVASIIQSTLYLVVGGPLFTLPSFMGWFWLAVIMSLSGSIVLLRYYDYKKYIVTFWTSALLALANLTQQVAFYLILSGERTLQTYYVGILFFVLVSGIAYSVSLIFFAAAEKIWLKRAGIFSLPVTCTLLVMLIINISSGDMSLKIAMQKGIEWVVLLTNILPLLLTLNFVNEGRHVMRENTTTMFPPSVTGVLQLICVAAFVSTLIVGGSIVNDSYMHLYWKKKNAEETAKLIQRGEERSFTNRKGETLKYLLIRPQGYNPNRKYPLVVSLPYGGYEAPPARLLASGDNPKRYPAFLFVPFCPEGAGWGGIPNYPTIDTLVFDAILKLEEEMSIDVNRRYVSGVSRGGYGSWHFITTRPDMFAAAIPVCGGGDTKLASRIVSIPVWAFHGALDHNVPVSNSRDMIEAIKKAGGDPKYTEFSNKDHNIWFEVTQTPGLLDWLFEQKKDSLGVVSSYR